MTDVIDLGDEHSITFVEFEGERAGVNVFHKLGNGVNCKGWVPFAGRAWAKAFGGKIETWEVESEDPLTLSPSIACRLCGDHGYIRDGKWARA